MSSEIQARLVADYLADGWEKEADSKRDYGNVVIVRRAGVNADQGPVWKRVAIYATGNRCCEPDQPREE